MDFMQDRLVSGRRFRTLNVLDDFNRESLAIEIDFSLPSARVVRVLEQVAQWRGYPGEIRLDNGPEFLAGALAEWAKAHAVILGFIEPGKPAQNAYIERFNRTYRTEVLDLYLFEELDQVRDLTTNWMYDYNTNRPHSALGGHPPATISLGNRESFISDDRVVCNRTSSGSGLRVHKA